jgi:hypothetical protein
LDEREIQLQLAEANTLLNAGHPKAGLLLAWASIEALLRLVVSREGLPARGSDPAALMRRAASEGLIDQDDYASLSNAFKVRSAIVHGFRPGQGDQSTDAVRLTQSLLRISESLLAELNNPAT